MSNETAELASQLSGGEPTQRLNAAERLAMMGPDAAPVAAALVEACANAELQDTCVGGLEEMGPPAADQIDRLAELAQSEEELVAYWAVTLLGRAGADASRYTAVLEGIASGAPSEAVRRRAAWATPKVAGA